LSEEEPIEPNSPGQDASFQPGASDAGMTDIGELFKRTWEVFKYRGLLLLGLYLLTFLVTGAVAGVFVGFGALLGLILQNMRAGILIGSAVAAVAGLIAFGWGYGAFVLAAAKDRLSFEGALKQSWQKVGSFIWVLILAKFIVMGGFCLFFVPGVIFATWFAFAIFIFAREGVTGMDALLKSKEYVRGYFWDVFLRFLVVGLILMGIGWVPIIGALLMLFAAPFMALYVYNIYTDLRRLKGEFEFLPSDGEKALYIALGALGLFAIPITIFAMAGMAFITPLLMRLHIPL